ncbi:carbonic anhydrase 14 isoform X1 [Otolemur garnettii]|uniref:carbonic anhydrase 14 isoform X1 n=1 Tax=Otolemur garnettii TaxID=30611 RepID=UPI000C7F4986|nr:carbonic anhydrase 14 isoform X1 [Otolemur garnettii]
MLFFALLLEVIWILATDGGQHWTYEGPHGQDHWPASYPECGSNAQSPIDIQTDSVTFDPELPPLQPHGYDQPGTEPLDLHNNGHTVQLSLPPTLYLGGLPRKYVAVQLHLHWGQKGSLGGSEHQINSEATAAELHIVHYDSDSYNSLTEAAQRPQGLAVLGILIEVGETKNIAYEHILSHLHEIRHKDQKTSVPPFNVKELLPTQLGQFFRYNGSLTTPPCYQSVLWTVFSGRVQISRGQVSGGRVRERHSCNFRPFPTPQSGTFPTLLLLSWKCSRRHCSPQKSPPTSWHRTTVPLSLSISAQSLLLLSKWDPCTPQVRQPYPGTGKALSKWRKGSISVSPQLTPPTFPLPGEILSLGVGILAGCLCLLLAAYFIARKIRKKRLENRKSVVFTSARATTEA